MIKYPIIIVVIISHWIDIDIHTNFLCNYFRLSPSVGLSANNLDPLSFDNLKTVKARHMKLGTWIISNVYHMLAQIWVATLKVKVTAWPCSKIVSGPYICYLKSHFTTISQKWSPYSVAVLWATFELLPWRSR